jgi:hypothetical protein
MDDAGPKTPEQEMRERTARYGAAYAVLADGFKGEGVDRLVKGVRWFLAGAAVFVVVAAVYARFLG